MDTQLLLHTKQMQGDEIVEIKIWDVPKSADKPHGVKISLVYVKSGKRMLGYDNAEVEATISIWVIEKNPITLSMSGSYWLISKRN